MNNRSPMVQPRSCRCGRQAGGFAVVSAIFLLVVLSALAAFIVQISTQQQIGHAADVQGTRAYQAARAGAEWGAFEHLRNGSCSASSSFALGGNLSGFTVTVQCLPAGGLTTNDENGAALVLRRIVATACNQPAGVAFGTCPNLAPGVNYVEREIVAGVGR